MDHTSMAIYGIKLWEVGVEVVQDEGGNYILVTIRDVKIVISVSHHKVVKPSRPRVHAWLWSGRGRGPILGINLYSFDFGILVQELSI